MSGPVEPERRDNSAYGLLGLLTLLNVINFVDRQLLASFANFIVPDLGLSNTEFGLLTGLVFLIFYAVAGLFMGALADLVHRPRLIAIALLLWSGLTAASGLARNFWSLALPRMFIGVGESALTPTAMSLLAERFPPARLGFATGIYYMGVPIGAGLSLIVAGLLGPTLGWRNCFLLLGAIGALFSLALFRIPETRVRRPPAASGRGGFVEVLSTLASTIARSRPLQFVIAAGVATHFMLGAAAFDQLWLVRERGFDKAEIAIISGVIASLAGVGGNLFGGLAADLWKQKTGQSRAMFLVWLLIVLLPLNLGYRLVDAGSPLFWIGITATYFQLGAFYGPSFATIQEHCPPTVRATVVAFYILMLNVVGLGIGVTGSGVMVDQLISRGVSYPYSWTLFAFTCASTLAIPLFYLAERSSRSASAAKLSATG